MLVVGRTHLCRLEAYSLREVFLDASLYSRCLVDLNLIVSPPYVETCEDSECSLLFDVQLSTIHYHPRRPSAQNANLLKRHETRRPKKSEAPEPRPPLSVHTQRPFER